MSFIRHSSTSFVDGRGQSPSGHGFFPSSERAQKHSPPVTGDSRNVKLTAHVHSLRRFRIYSYVILLPLLHTSAEHIAHLPQQCHNSKCMIFQEKLLEVLKCYNFQRVQIRHNCSPVASFANCVMTIYLLKVHLQTFLSIPITQKCQILSCDTLVAKERRDA